MKESNWCNYLNISLLCLVLLFSVGTISADVVSTTNTKEAIAALRSGEWLEIPNSNMRQTILPVPVDEKFGNVRGIMKAWNGAALDTTRDRLVVWGGGHANYAGNELYAFDLRTLRWTRLTGPSRGVSEDVDGDGDFDKDDERTGIYPDGKPRSRHTYDDIEYVPSIDRFCSFGGSAMWRSGGAGTYKTQCFGFENNRWETRAEKSLKPRPGGFSAFDPVSGYVWAGKFQLERYDPVTDRWGGKTEYTKTSNYLVMTVEPERRLLVAAGGHGQVYTWDISDPEAEGIPAVKRAVAGSGFYDKHIALDYDSASGKIVAWNGGSEVYSLDLKGMRWIRHLAASSNKVTPTDPQSNGTYGRFRYVPSMDVFVLVNAIDKNVYVYRFANTPGEVNYDGA